MKREVIRFLGLLILTFLYAKIARFLDVKFWWEFALLIGGAAIFGRKGLVLAVLASFWRLVFEDGLSSLQGLASNYQIESNLIGHFAGINGRWLGVGDRFCLVLVSFSLIAILVFALGRMSRASHLSKNFFIGLFALLCLYGFDSLRDHRLKWAVLLAPMMVLLSHQFLFLLAFHPQMKFSGLRQWWGNLSFFVVPIWDSAFFSYMPRERLNWFDYVSTDPEEVWKTKISGFVLVFRGLAYYLIGQLLQRLIHGRSRVDWFERHLPSMMLPDFANVGFKALLLQEVSLGQLWLIVFAHSLLFLLLAVAPYGCFAFGTARLLGMRMHANFYSPLKSISYSDFISRILYYYTFFISQVFYLPILSSLGWMRKWKTFRKFLSLVLAVWLGGSFYHLVRDFDVFLQYGFWKVLQFRLEVSPYFLLFALMIGLSRYFEVPMRWRHRLLARVPFVALYFMIYSVILLFHTNYYAISFDDRCRFILTLFGLQ